jgi:hypothetical protein
MTPLLVLIYRLLKLFSIFSEKTTILLLRNAISFYNETEGDATNLVAMWVTFRDFDNFVFNSQERPSMLPNEL